MHGARGSMTVGRERGRERGVHDSGRGEEEEEQGDNEEEDEGEGEVQAIAREHARQQGERAAQRARKSAGGAVIHRFRGGRGGTSKMASEREWEVGEGGYGSEDSELLTVRD